MTLTDLVNDPEAFVPSAAEGGENAPADLAASRRRGHALGVALVLLLFAGSVAGLVWAALDWSGAKRPATPDDAIAAARAEALNILTLDYRTAQRDLQRVIDSSIGSMQQQYRGSETSLINTAASGKSVSTGTILSYGLSYPKNTPVFDGKKAEVLIAADATVRFGATKTTKANTLRVRYRFLFEMQKQGNVWKAAQLNFAGLPSYSQVPS